VFALSGCGGGDDYYYDDDPVIVDPGPELVTLFLVDEFYVGVEFIPYVCIDAYDEIITEDVTTITGEFTFAIGDRCTFDLFNFLGDTYSPLYIEDIDGFGKDDIPYYCDNTFGEFSEGATDFDGWFAYPEEAFCKFYF
jgi:hypothetical protein